MLMPFLNNRIYAFTCKFLYDAISFTLVLQ